MDNFTKAEITNRVKAVAAIKSILSTGWDIIETPPEAKERWDFELRKDNERILVEHKDRSYNSTDFSDWMISGDKYNYLVSLPFKVVYINTFKDGKYAIWDLKRTKKEIRPSRHKSKTVVNSSWVTKQEVFLKIKDAAKYGEY